MLGAATKSDSASSIDSNVPIRVVLRIRPLSVQEQESDVPVHMQPNLDSATHTTTVTLTRSSRLQPSLADKETTATQHQFTFDDVYGLNETLSPDASQEQLYQGVGQPLLDHLLRGYNACLIAYGATNAGKSYSVLGHLEAPGIMPRLCESLLVHLSQKQELDWQIQVTFIEIYNEQVRDLLRSSPSGKQHRVREHPIQGPYVENVTQCQVKTVQDMMQLLKVGLAARTVASTQMNAQSSRSHAIFTLILSLNKENRTSRLSLVDLAGSEKAHGHALESRMKEGTRINQSLTNLGLVITALAAKSQGRSQQQQSLQHVPYRASLLTYLLKPCLGGNAFTTMLANVSPAQSCLSETLATMRYACRARSIVNHAQVVNNDQAEKRMIRSLQQRIDLLTGELMELKSSKCENDRIQELTRRLQQSERMIQQLLHQQQSQPLPSPESLLDDWSGDDSFLVPADDLSDWSSSNSSFNNLNNFGNTATDDRIVLQHRLMSLQVQMDAERVRSEQQLMETQRAYEQQLILLHQQLTPCSLQIEVSSSRYVQDFHVYSAQVTLNRDQWRVTRRYGEWRQVHELYADSLSPALLALFPPRQWFGCRTEKVVEARRIRLDAYLKALLTYLLQQRQRPPLSRAETCLWLPWLQPDGRYE